LGFCDRELGVNPDNREALLTKSKLLARSGRIGEALTVVKAYDSLDSHDPLDGLDLALVYLRSGDMGAVKNTLEQAVQQGYPRALILAEPEFVSLREDTWFKTLLDGGDSTD